MQVYMYVGRWVGRYIHINIYVLLNNIYVQPLGDIRTLCNYNVTTLVACATKRIYDVVKNTKTS